MISYFKFHVSGSGLFYFQNDWEIRRLENWKIKILEDWKIIVVREKLFEKDYVALIQLLRVFWFTF